MQQHRQYEVTVDKLIHGGQALGTLPDGKKALVWGALPGETIRFKTVKNQRDFVEGVCTDVLMASDNRISPRDDAYLSTSPWQIMDESVEDEYKRSILQETFQRAGLDGLDVALPHATEKFFGYRNKMEYSFYGDESGLHLALYNRGTHRKQIVKGSSIANPAIDQTATKIVEILNDSDVRAGDLKTVVLRCNQSGDVVAALYTRREDFPDIPDLDKVCKGIAVVYSNPRSPASVRTEDLRTYGDISLNDEINGTSVGYDVFSFFQVNLNVFEKVVSEIAVQIGDKPAIDMYSGVGAIGMALPSVRLLVESDSSNIVWAKKNAANRQGTEVAAVQSENALDYINGNNIVILDPPRAGLHSDVTNRLLEVSPPKIVYLSCNPSTQARDVSLLHEKYEIAQVSCYNFFPRTPHIESLVILNRK